MKPLHMKNTLLLCFLIVVLTGCQQAGLPTPGIIPQPAEIEYQQGVFEVNTNTVLVVPATGNGQKLAEELQAFLKDRFRLDLKTATEDQPNAIHLVKSGTNVPGAYQLTVSESGILIESSTEQGLFYGIQTLKQLMSPQAVVKAPVLRFVRIQDKPAFLWRGMMLDVSRHFFPKDSVKKVIDILAMHKMNKFHWHLVDGIGWRIETERYPELTRRGAWRKVKAGKQPWEDFETADQHAEGEVYGGYYTKADIQEIVAYAADRYIDIIPEIEMPGHSETALQCYPELACDGQGAPGVYCAGNEKTFEFLQNIISEVVELFPGEYLHIGGDEVGKEGWLQCPKCRRRMQVENLQSGEELQSYFVKRMEAFIHSKGKKLIGWDEILEGGLPERATVMSWRGVKGGVEAANAGHDFVLSPGSPLYFDHSQGKSEFEPPSWGGYNNLLSVYNFDPVPDEIEPGKEHHILGGQANLWTEQVRTLRHAQYMMLPRLCALSEVLWTPPAQKSQSGFIEKMDVHFDRLSDLGYHFAGSALSPDYEVAYDKGSATFSLSLKNELGLYEIRYTLDGSEPTMDSKRYNSPITYTSPIEVKAQCFRKGIPIGFPLQKLFSTGFGEQCEVIYTNPYHETYSGGGDKALVNNRFAIARGDDPNWQGFPKKDFDVKIDLGGPKKLSYVGLNFFQHISATSVMLPTRVDISISEDGQSFTPVLETSVATSKERDPVIKRIETAFEEQWVAFIKISATNRAVLPDWHIREGDAWLFVDEISVK